jgi:hypothetical protein
MDVTGKIRRVARKICQVGVGSESGKSGLLVYCMAETKT